MVYTPDEFTELVDSFINHCEINKQIPDDYNLLKFSGNKLSSRTLDRYFGAANDDSEDEPNDTENGKVDYKAYGEAIKKLIIYREHSNSELAIANPKTIGFVNFRAKQGRWGRWTDKQESVIDATIRVKIGDGGTDLLD